MKILQFQVYPNQDGSESLLKLINWSKQMVQPDGNAILQVGRSVLPRFTDKVFKSVNYQYSV